jgi:signal transduction histidine kinase
VACVDTGSRLNPRLASAWNGPPDLPPALRLEWRLVAVRWLGIACIAPALLLAHLSPERLLAAYVVVSVATVYNASLRHIIPRRPEWLANGYVSTVGDAVLQFAIVLIGGGFDSPFYFILFTVTLAAAMRYGYGRSLGVALLYVSADSIGYLAARQPIGDAFVVRSLLLPLTTLLVGYLREQAQRAECALQERLRQSSALNEVTGMVGASLELDAVLRAAMTASAEMFSSQTALLRSSVLVDPMVLGAAGAATTLAELERLCALHDEPVSVHTLSDGQTAIVLQLILPARQACLATIAVAMPASASVGIDSDILNAFVERITLAIENASLYRTLADRSHDLQRAYSDLAAAHQELLSVDEMKTNFLANVSHELRTPLTSIRSFSELLLDYEQDANTQKEFLRIISTESERLTRLVNDVLDISRIEAGHMNWTLVRLDVTDLLEDLGRTFGPLIGLAGQNFDVSLDPELPDVHGDRDRLNQVIANLLNNAMKFTPHGGTIALRASVVGDEIHISVSDTGVGIPAEDHVRIFEKFQQVGNTLTDKPRGTGLGLPICRDIVTHHQGRMWVESTPGAGSTFTVALPAAARRVAEVA